MLISESTRVEKKSDCNVGAMAFDDGESCAPWGQACQSSRCELSLRALAGLKDASSDERLSDRGVVGSRGDEVTVGMHAAAAAAAAVRDSSVTRGSLSLFSIIVDMRSRGAVLSAYTEGAEAATRESARESSPAANKKAGARRTLGLVKPSLPELCCPARSSGDKGPDPSLLRNFALLNCCCMQEPGERGVPGDPDQCKPAVPCVASLAFRDREDPWQVESEAANSPICMHPRQSWDAVLCDRSPREAWVGLLSKDARPPRDA